MSHRCSMRWLRLISGVPLTTSGVCSCCRRFPMLFKVLSLYHLICFTATNSCFNASHWWLCVITCLSWHSLNGAVFFQVSHICLVVWVLLILGVPLLFTELVLCGFRSPLWVTGVTQHCPRLPTATYWGGCVLFHVYYFLFLGMLHIVPSA